MRKIDVCKTLMPPFPNIWTISLTFDPDLWPTDLSINRDHLLNKDNTPTKLDASGAKRSWVIRRTRFGRLARLFTLTFDLLTWVSLGAIYSSRGIFLSSLQRVWHASRGCLPFRTPGSVPLFGTCLCSNCWDQIPRTCHVLTRLFTLNILWYFPDFAFKFVELSVLEVK